MNLVERAEAYAHIKQQELMGTIGGKLVAEYAKRQGNFERHQRDIFEKIERGNTPTFSEATPTDEQLQMQKILKNY